MDQALFGKAAAAVEAFINWLDRYGETSYDHQSYYAGAVGRAAKALYYRSRLLGTVAVAPMVFSEAFLPSARRLFWKPQRFPIADAHYAMGFAFLAGVNGASKHYQRAVHFLNVLEDTRCPGIQEYCWGYPFDWETRTGVMKRDTPLITTEPYCYEAFSQIYAIDKSDKWLSIMRSIARHAFTAYRNVATAPNAASCGYTPAPNDPAGVVNASAYRAFLLTKAGYEVGEPKYLEVANQNLNFVLQSQNSDGSWYYSTDGARDFVDHFHTCFVLKALSKIEQLNGSPECARAIERGVDYYVRNLFDAEGLPLPFSKRPRMTVYRRELYDYAECINIGVLLAGRSPAMEKVLSRVMSDLFSRWQRPDGAFRARELLLGWDNTPMHRWAQAQLFRSLSFYLAQASSSSPAHLRNRILQPIKES